MNWLRARLRGRPLWTNTMKLNSSCRYGNFELATINGTVLLSSIKSKMYLNLVVYIRTEALCYCGTYQINGMAELRMAPSDGISHSKHSLAIFLSFLLVLRLWMIKFELPGSLYVLGVS